MHTRIQFYKCCVNFLVKFNIEMSFLHVAQKLRKFAFVAYFLIVTKFISLLNGDTFPSSADKSRNSSEGAFSTRPPLPYKCGII